MPPVSVIIPNYNRAAVIGETIENMLRQSLSPHEVIVVDDGSTDDSISVIQSFGDRVTLIQQSNQGPGAARNAGLNVASGEFIQFMDSDDLASLNKLEVQVKQLIQQQADIVYGPWAKAWFQSGKLQLQDVVLQQQALPASRSPLLWFLTAWSMVFQQCLVRRSLLIHVGGYREDMRLYEDGELFVRLLLAEAKIIYEPESLTLYRLNDYGKLTETGSHADHKTVDQAKFYLAVAKLLHQHPQFQAFLQHPEFRFNRWRVWKDLKHSQKQDQAILNPLFQDFNALLGKIPDATQMSCKQWWVQTQKGLQQRLQGHRWHPCFMPGSLTPQQQDLIKELGFCLK